jgi:hypothetical protein
MHSPNLDTDILAEPADPQAVPAQGAGGAPVEAATQKSYLDELLEYQPVPPRRVVAFSIPYQHLGRGRPLPYLLEDDGE